MPRHWNFHVTWCDRLITYGIVEAETEAAARAKVSEPYPNYTIRLREIVPHLKPDLVAKES